MVGGKETNLVQKWQRMKDAAIAKEIGEGESSWTCEGSGNR